MASLLFGDFFCGFGGIFRRLQVVFSGVYSFLDFNDEANEEEILETCKNCDLTEPKASILIHIGNTKACKAHYGPRFKAMKALNEREQKERQQEIKVLKTKQMNQLWKLNVNSARNLFLNHRS